MDRLTREQVELLDDRRKPFEGKLAVADLDGLFCTAYALFAELERLRGIETAARRTVSRRELKRYEDGFVTYCADISELEQALKERE